MSDDKTDPHADCPGIQVAHADIMEANKKLADVMSFSGEKGIPLIVMSGLFAHFLHNINQEIVEQNQRAKLMERVDQVTDALSDMIGKGIKVVPLRVVTSGETDESADTADLNKPTIQ